MATKLTKDVERECKRPRSFGNRNKHGIVRPLIVRLEAGSERIVVREKGLRKEYAITVQSVFELSLRGHV
jgi:hypothetical protein